MVGRRVINAEFYTGSTSGKKIVVKTVKRRGYETILAGGKFSLVSEFRDGGIQGKLGCSIRISQLG